MPAPIVSAVNRLETRLAHQLIVHGRQQAELLRAAYGTPDARINVVPLGVPAAFRSMASEHVGRPEPRTVLFFGRLRAYKGLEVLLQAVPEVAARIPDLRVVVAGEGSYPIVQQAAAEHPERYTVINRFIPAAEVASLFQRAGVVVLPYVEATQSGVVPLAYLFGRPVVATRVGSIPEVVDDGSTGYLVPPGDPGALASAMIRLLEDDERREAMGRAAAAKAERDLSWGAIAARTTAVYERARQQLARRLPALSEV
jgi:glycosyltransferase involved in cell wall biosynthesis